MKSIYSKALGIGILCFLVGCEQETSAPVASPRMPDPPRSDYRTRPDPAAGFNETGSQIRSQPGATIMISEFMAANDAVIRDGRGRFSDWIEIYNFGDVDVKLEGFSLTDDFLEPGRWRFPERTLSSREYLVVFASGTEDEVPGELHCSFRLASDGEFLGLASPNGDYIHQFEPSYPRQKTDLSFGIGSEWQQGQMPIDYEGYFEAPTPGAENASFLLGDVEPVKFSQGRGVFQGRFDLELSTKTKGATIYYTTDGRHPDIRNGQAYEGPLPIDRTTVVSARAEKPQFRSSRIKTATFLMPEMLETQAGQRSEIDLGLPIVSLTTHFSNSEENYGGEGLTGRESEQRVTIEWIDLAGGNQWAENAGIRIRNEGGTPTKDLKNSFRVYFRDQYGPAQLKESLFGPGSASAYDRIELQAVDDVKEAMWKHICHDLMGAAREPYLRGRFCQLYFNGAFLGLYELTERPGLRFAAEYFGGKRSDFDIIRKTLDGDNDGEWYEVMEGENDAWQQMLTEVEAGDFSLLEVDNVISFLLVASFLEGTTDFNIGDWVAIRNRKGKQGFRCLLGDRVSGSRGTNLERSGIGNSSALRGIWSQINEDTEGRIRVKDLVHNLYFSTGPLSSGQFDSRVGVLGRMLELAIRADGARWAKNEQEMPPLPLEERRTEQIEWLRSLGLVSSMGTTTWGLPEGPVNVGEELVLGVGRGDIVFTLDGSDPRSLGGDVNPIAAVYSGPIVFTEATIVSCRIRLGNEWGPIERRAFDILVK